MPEETEHTEELGPVPGLAVGVRTGRWSSAKPNPTVEPRYRVVEPGGRRRSSASKFVGDLTLVVLMSEPAYVNVVVADFPRDDRTPTQSCGSNAGRSGWLERGRRRRTL